MSQTDTWPHDSCIVVAELDRQFQAAVKRNDAETINRILADDHILVCGDGSVFTKSDALREARERETLYEIQDETEKTVRVWGPTAVVTARLWIKGVRRGRPINYRLWYSDTYVLGPDGWRYAFGQASLPLPDLAAGGGGELAPSAAFDRPS